MQPIVDVLRDVGEQNEGKTPAQVALRWLIQKGTRCRYPGAKTAQQARDNAGALGWMSHGQGHGGVGWGFGEVLGITGHMQVPTARMCGVR